MANGHESGSQFVVDLGEIKLPPLVEKQVAAEIEATVLRALADSDFGSAWRDVPADVPRDVPPRPFPFKSKEESPWGFVATDPPDPKPLEVSDHTEIMKAIMDNPLQVLRCLPKKYKNGGGRPSGEEVLEATLRVDQIGDRVKDRIRAALRLAPKIEEVQAALPEPVKQAVDSLRQQLTNKTVQEKLSLLRNAGLRNTHRGLAEGMEVTDETSTRR